MRAILHDVTVADEEQDEREDWQARPLVYHTERDYWKFWIWLYWLMRAEEEVER